MPFTRQKGDAMTTIIRESIEVNVPIEIALLKNPPVYDGMIQVIQLDVTRLYWKAEVAGQIKGWPKSSNKTGKAHSLDKPVSQWSHRSSPSAFKGTSKVLRTAVLKTERDYR
jgi:hypothetical protein